ncbi:MAG: VOC family protein [Gammaproteobacteria bacterium]|nr:VOC family protein [Gammaproteobacteria bacterium]
MKVLGLHHVSLVVADTARALAFYRDVLGLERIDDRPALAFDGAWLRLGDRQLHLLELPNPDPVDGRPAHGGRDRHTAIAVRDLAGFAARLERAGIPFTRSRSGREALFCRDPDGNAWELIQADD